MRAFIRARSVSFRQDVREIAQGLEPPQRAAVAERLLNFALKGELSWSHYAYAARHLSGAPTR